MILTKTNKLHCKNFSCRFFFFIILAFSQISFGECYKSYSKIPKNKVYDVLLDSDLTGDYFACYTEDVLKGIPYKPLINCIDQSKKKIGLYDVKYKIELTKKDKLLISVNDPFIGKERSSRVSKVCFEKEKIILKARFVNIQLYRNQERLELSYKFLFKRYFQILIKQKNPLI